MKRNFIHIIAATTVMAFFFVVSQSATMAGSGKGNGTTAGTPLPDSIKKVITRACMDCHADDGNFMAKGKVNFSQWETYSTEKQAGKANTICKELTKSSMPPKKWRSANATEVRYQTHNPV